MVPIAATEAAPRSELAARTSEALSPGKLLELGFAFWASKALLTGVELGLFTTLAQAPLDREALRAKLGLHERSSRDFFDALVALDVLRRDGDVYSNTPEADLFLDRAKPTYVGGLLEMANARLYGAWGGLGRGLKTGKPQSEAASDGADVFATLYADPARLRLFLEAMSGVSLGPAIALAQRFPWKDYRTFVDVGAAQGVLPVQVATAHPHLVGRSFDLAACGPIFEEYVRRFGLEKRLSFQAGDFFEEPLPEADVLVMGHILHGWDLPTKRMLLEKAYRALPEGGSLIVYEALIDDDRRVNAFGLLMSLNMLIETPGGFDYTGADCCGWMREAGFRATRVEHLAGPASMVVGVK